jgi:hypothetical protein
MPKLLIAHIPLTLTGPWRQVEVTWQGDPVRREAESEFSCQPTHQDDEKILWYLEDYAGFPTDPAPALAMEAEACLSG